ncbi:hypothetical protein CDD83_4912 [Cordyceps sp. RAO-2017]|nr:hypothetical protein CDD83_4912 [Cordyceps sp. RAO-2017]
MHASGVFPSSLHCAPSPDGRFVATLRASTLSVRSVETLRLVNVVKVPPASGGPVSGFLWAPSSSKILISTADQIQIFSAADASFHASVHNPASAGGKHAAVYFGARDTEVLACSAFGLKLSVLDLSSSHVVDISNPKFCHPSTASRGFCLRPGSGHLALLTRSNGKDLVSVHHPTSRQLQRSWSPDTVDAQGLIWTLDGRWLLLWDSPVHGLRLLLYTPDGQQFRTIDASSLSNARSPVPDPSLGLGVKVCQLSSDAELCAVGDYSRGVAVVSTQSWRERMKLLHPTLIVPLDTTQVWQEQLACPGQRQPAQPFQRATLTIAPPGPPPDGKGAGSASPGCSLAGFDASSTLLATRLDDAPSTLWIWDLAAAELRAVLIFHSHVTFHWHPLCREVLLVTCQDEGRRGASFVWDPLSNGPVPVSPEHHLPAAKEATAAAGKPRVAWISRESDFPELLVADAQHYVLLSLSGPGDDSVNPWAEEDWQDGTAMPEADDLSALDDTFSFKHA